MALASPAPHSFALFVRLTVLAQRSGPGLADESRAASRAASPVVPANAHALLIRSGPDRRQAARAACYVRPGSEAHHGCCSVGGAPANRTPRDAPASLSQVVKEATEVAGIDARPPVLVATEVDHHP